MKWYVVRRVAWALFATWVAMSFTWGLFTVSPNSGELQAAQAAAQAGGDAEEAMEDYRQAHGLDRPLWEQYVSYVLNMFTFNWGWSTAYDRPVIDVILGAWPYTFQYVFLSVILSGFMGFGLGVYSAMRRHTNMDYLASAVGFFGLSIPNFWFAVMLILILGVWMKDATLFGVDLSWFQMPTYYDTSVITKAEGGLFGHNLIDPDSGFEYGWISLKNIKQILIPVVVISTASFASQLQLTRAETLDVVNEEFVKTARAKGASEIEVWLRHVFRVALVPLSTLVVGDVIAFLIGGSVVIEQIFSIPGLGLMVFNAITVEPDTAVVMAGSLLPIFLVIIAYLLQDLTYVVLDPRIDYGDR